MVFSAHTACVVWDELGYVSDLNHPLVVGEACCSFQNHYTLIFLVFEDKNSEQYQKTGEFAQQPFHPLILQPQVGSFFLLQNQRFPNHHGTE